MKVINQVLINGQFLEPAGTEVQDLFNPTTAELIGQVRLGNKDDVNKAVKASG